MADGSPSIDVPIDRVTWRRNRRVSPSDATDALARDARALPPSINDSYDRPRTRGDCLNGSNVRPCPWASCGHHLAYDVDEQRGSLIVNREIAIEDMRETCSLDMADEGALNLSEVGALLGLSRERVRQIEERALDKLRAECARLGLQFEDLLGAMLERTEEPLGPSEEDALPVTARKSADDRARRLLQCVIDDRPIAFRGGQWSIPNDALAWLRERLRTGDTPGPREIARKMGWIR